MTSQDYTEQGNELWRSIKQMRAQIKGIRERMMEARLTDEFNQDKISSNDTKI